MEKGSLFISRAMMESMEELEGLQTRRRIGESGSRRANRSASNHSSSSTSSDILVAAGPPSSTPGKPAVTDLPLTDTMAKGTVAAEIRDKHILVVRLTGVKNLAILQQLANDDAVKEQQRLENPPRKASNDNTTIKNDELDDENDGPNHRGTYSKAYILQHPEMKWQHRGQGRYLPVGKGGRPSNLSRSQS